MSTCLGVGGCPVQGWERLSTCAKSVGDKVLYSNTLSRTPTHPLPVDTWTPTPSAWTELSFTSYILIYTIVLEVVNEAPMSEMPFNNDLSPQF